MLSVPERYIREKTAAGFDRIDYGVGGISLFEPADLSVAQIGYGVTSDGISLAGENDG